MLTLVIPAFFIFWPATVPVALAALVVGYKVRSAAAVWWIIALYGACGLGINLVAGSYPGDSGAGMVAMGATTFAAVYVLVPYGIGALVHKILKSINDAYSSQ